MSGGATDRPILLVGAAGQIGAALAPRLAELGPVVCVVRRDAELERPEDVRALVRRVAPRLVINAAAYTAVDDAERDEARCARVNGEAPGVLASAAAEVGAPMVHYSTNYVFDGEDAHPYSEDAPMAPVNVYGRTKAAGERAVAAANPAHLIFRTAAVYGWTGRNFMRRILALAREREELQVVDDQLVAPTPASAVADATVAVLTRAFGRAGTNGPFGTFHLTTAGDTTWFGFASRILALDPKRAEQRVRRIRAVRSEEFPTAARRPRNGVLNTDKLARLFGVRLPDWETELRRTIADIR